MNYKIENNINFYTELLNDAYSNNIEKSIETPKCLIDKLPLGDNKITLTCNHSFNYLALYTELYNLKYKTTYKHRLRRNEIKCPYCRKIHSYIMPYIPEEMIDKTIGVNWPPKYALMPSTCKYIYKSGKCKGEACFKPCLFGKIIDMCSKHNKLYKISTNVLTEHCQVLLKSGKRIGQPCGAIVKTCNTNNQCLRHYKKPPLIESLQ